MNDRISFRLGHLAEPLYAWCQSADCTPSEYIRQLIADDLGCRAPQLTPGNPNIGKHARRAAKARWGKRRPT